MDYYHKMIDVATNPYYTPQFAPLILFSDACLTALIIMKVPYTEIDYSTYMQQVSLYLSGERDYTLLKGDTGPLVYPAGHVYIYSVLHWLTNGGERIDVAQWVFGGVYLGILAVVMAGYVRAGAPPYLLPLLILSKRLHSIFVLRLFNDGFVVGALFLAIYAFQRRMWTIGSIVFSVGVGIKMSLLPALPGVIMILGQAMTVQRAVHMLFIMGQVQALIAVPFLSVNAKGYMSRAFQLTRQFLFKWTVNWRFVGEEAFLSRGFSLSLIATHLSLLALFATTLWIRPSGLSIPQLVRRVLKPLPEKIERRISIRVDPGFIETTILSSLAIGMLCARSLHYQFYAYIAWTTPLLLWKANFHPVFTYAVWAAQEWAWNIYPSTSSSSIVVISCLVIQVIGLWIGDSSEIIPAPENLDEDLHKH